ncbi:hypothetical protein TNCV_2420281 [Trichonephila clavipes]|nr:hypothetical protein TNCV_2420281 [Trichonephila clavipes]
MDKENASAATGSQVSVVSFSSLSAFNVPTALARLNELHTSQDCNDFCEMLEELIFKSCNNNESALGQCKRTSKSPNKGKAKKAKPSEEVIALSNSFSAIAHLEVDVKDLNEDNVVDTAPGTEEEDSIPQAPVEDPCNIDMIDNEQESQMSLR